VRSPWNWSAGSFADVAPASTAFAYAASTSGTDSVSTTCTGPSGSGATRPNISPASPKVILALLTSISACAIRPSGMVSRSVSLASRARV
jgi:hypothetical protein